MKYFTDEKFESNRAHTEYESYCLSIWKTLSDDIKCINAGMLPEKMLEGLPRIFLHDSRITQFFQTDNILTIEFDADNDGGLRKVNLVYQNPKVINLPSENVLGNGIDDGDSDLMCHEIEAIEESLYLHSMLFASGEELVIQFGALNVRYRDIV